MSDQPAKRSEEEIVAGLLTVTLGGTHRKPLRVLTMREARVWKLSLVGKLGGEIGSLDLASTKDVGPLIEAASDRILDLVVAYDVDGTLGGREWLEDHASDLEVYSVFRRLLEVSFPFVRDLRTALAEIRALGLADLLAGGRSPSASSSNGGSPDGVSASTAPLLTSN